MTAFLNNPPEIKSTACPSCSLVSFGFFLIWGMKSAARTIGPATNCGKKVTKKSKIVQPLEKAFGICDKFGQWYKFPPVYINTVTHRLEGVEGNPYPAKRYFERKSRVPPNH